MVGTATTVVYGLGLLRGETDGVGEVSYGVAGLGSGEMSVFSLRGKSGRAAAAGSTSTSAGAMAIDEDQSQAEKRRRLGADDATTKQDVKPAAGRGAGVRFTAHKGSIFAVDSHKDLVATGADRDIKVLGMNFEEGSREDM